MSAAGSASALSPTLSFNSFENAFDISFTVGFEFTVGTNNLIVDALGIYDFNQDGLITKFLPNFYWF